MKKILLIAIALFTTITFAQENNNVKLDKKGDITEATYFYASGEVQQHGFFNEEGKVHGEWTSFDENGNKLAVGKYENGKKVGTWLFWTNNTVKEVNYTNSRISSVNVKKEHSIN